MFQIWKGNLCQLNLAVSITEYIPRKIIKEPNISEKIIRERLEFLENQRENLLYSRK